MGTKRSPRGGDPAQLAAADTSLKSKAMRGTVVSVLGTGTSQFLRLLCNMLLSRILFPEAFGLMALVNLLITGLHLFSDVGLNLSIVQNKRGEEPDFLNTVWTLSVARGFVLWVCGVCLASPFAKLYGEPLLAEVVPVATFTAVLHGLASTKMVGLHRRLTLGRFVLIELVTQVCAILVMVAHGLVYRSIWSLIVGLLASAAFRTVLSYVAVPGPGNRLAWAPGAVREIVSFGKWVFVSTVTTFLTMRLDVILLGKLIPLRMLGVYSMGIALTSIPSQIITRVGELVVLPALSASYREDRGKLVGAFLRVRSIVLPCALSVVLGVALLAPVFFYALYDERYHDAGWIAALATVDVWFVSLQELYSRALLASGDARPLIAINLTKLAVGAAAAMVGYHVAGVPGFIIGGALGKLAGLTVVVGSLRRHGIRTGRHEAMYTVVGLALGLVAGGAPYALAGDLSRPGQLSAAVAVAFLVLFPLGLWTLRLVMCEMRGQSLGSATSPTDLSGVAARGENGQQQRDASLQGRDGGRCPGECPQL
jgi:O-antigen/teichoic acid export membrane protein